MLDVNQFEIRVRDSTECKVIKQGWGEEKDTLQQHKIKRGNSVSSLLGPRECRETKDPDL